jgi:drug/metabolite transporter (DMT)-like permease
VVAGATLATGLGGGGPREILFSLGALACEAAFSLLALPLLPKLGAVRVSAYASAAAVPMLAVLGVVTGDLLRVPTLPEALGLGYLSTVVSAGAFLLWYSALPKLGADRAGLSPAYCPSEPSSPPPSSGSRPRRRPR